MWRFFFTSGIATLFCYLELHPDNSWKVENLTNVYSTCSIQCYGGPVVLQEIAKKVTTKFQLIMFSYAPFFKPWRLGTKYSEWYRFSIICSYAQTSSCTSGDAVYCLRMLVFVLLSYSIKTFWYFERRVTGFVYDYLFSSEHAWLINNFSWVIKLMEGSFTYEIFTLDVYT